MSLAPGAAFRPPNRTSTVFRRVAVDRTDPAKPIVHIWAFTT
jgi:hypothetical protein